ncbi:putative bifunctional diguanylate cyclase/phosphodiesterase [Sedimentitalea nanhaiensis]|uniref:Diguanylate cyclase/phosphodiesterase n=1 Tax=Sedimentitalea nanhaiensis TaxID=999627 RepID=A0A1I7CMQ1_9RHOB|nr:bifunctional diguanylate cyclase/phosphodiesterase [Sedimentitalea nanhaiensis]SFU00658.1 diguanylate cyclase/phosphodiesterase [Sedimentitalea nanhaiensis]
MSKQPSGPLTRLQNRIIPVLTGPPILAFLPAVTLGAFWLGGEQALVVASLLLPLGFALLGAFGGWPNRTGVPRDSVTGLILRDGFDAVIAQVYEDTETSGLRSACFVLELDDYQEVVDRHGQAAADIVAQRCGERIISTLRDGDTVARMGDSRFAICLLAVRQLDLELCIQISGRLQSAIEEPVSLDGLSVYVSCSIGFCLRSRSPGNTGQDWMDAASAALSDAKQTSPSAIRAYSVEIHRKTKARSDLRDDAVAALENGQIQPWYQPQISTDTGKVTGFEALARWAHPVHGLIAPDTFLPTMEESGLMERLGQVMLYHALTALKAWDSAGVDVPRVGVNFATDELRNPGLVDKVRWELDRFELAPERLSVEILETVVTDCPDDVVTRNIAGLAAMGCRIDLDDFGTGHASIASIRRFAISRIKIDRSFVMKADRDPEQQRLIGAILTMAERLELETLAEGVETVGEHALLAQLGCDHVQGFGIARPMPFDQTLDWITSHQAKLQDAPRIGRDVS